ncbi:MAG: DNA translocase FtsK [Candidatus Saccharibacteria bacterium]
MNTKVTLKHIVDNPDPLGRELDLNDPYDKEEYIIQLTIRAMRDQIDQQNRHNCTKTCPNCGHDLSGVYLCSDNDDDLYDSVVNFVIESKKASASLIQHKFRVGYARAARMIDELENNGIISPANGPEPRKVLK